MNKLKPYEKFFEKSKVLYFKRSFRQALTYLNKALELVPSYEKELIEEILLLKAQLFIKRGNYKQKKQDFAQAERILNRLDIAEHIDEAAIELTRGEFYLKTKDYAKAMMHGVKSLSASKLSNNPSFLIKSHILLSNLYSERRNQSKAVEYAEKAIALLNDDVPTAIRVHCLANQISLFKKEHQFNKIAQNAPSVLELAQSINDVEHEIKLQNELGIINSLKGQYKVAYEKFSDALEKAEKIGFNAYAAKILVNIGNVYSDLYNYEEATRYTQRAIDSFSDTLTGTNLGIAYHNLGGKYLLKEDKESSLHYFFKSIEIGKKENFPPLISRSLYYITRIFIEKGEIEKAIKYSEDAYPYFENLGNTSGREINLVNLAHIQMYRGNTEEALELALESAEICKKIKNQKTLTRVYLTLTEIYEQLENYKKATEYHHLYAAMQKELYSDIRRRQMIDLEIQYELQKKEKEIGILKNKMQYQELQLRQQKEIEEQNIKLHNANEDLKQFTYAVSHDLRAPLRAINSFSQLIYSELKQEINQNEEVKEYFDFVINGATRMNSMLSGLLKYATLGTDAKDFRWIDLQEVLLDISKNLYMPIKESGATIENEILPSLYTNRVLITQLLQNLVSNGIKFRKPNVKPLITVHSEEKENTILISVKDNGIGIPERHQASIFKIFERLHDDKTYEGTGIGLAMCKKIVNHLRGKIYLESKEGIGTTFFIELPKEGVAL